MSSAAPHKASPLTSSRLYFGPSLKLNVFFYIEVPKTAPRTRDCCSAVQSRTIPSLSWLAMLGLMHPRTRLALLVAARALLTHTQFSIDQDPRSLPTAALYPLAPQSIHTSRVALSQVQNPALALAEFHMLGDCPSLEVSAGPLSLRELTATPNLVSMANPNPNVERSSTLMCSIYVCKAL